MTTENLVPYPPRGLVLALQYYEADEARAMRVARLLADIEPRRRAGVILCFFRRHDTPASQLLYETQLHCGFKFGTMTIQARREGAGHPHGCNELWSSCMEQLSEAWSTGLLGTDSVFTLEADGVALRADWLDKLLAEHARAIDEGKRVTGASTHCGTRHINGSLISHLSLWPDRPSLHRTPPHHAWDLFHAPVLTAEARPTTWIKNIYGPGEWSDASLKVLAAETAWLSSSKDDSALAWAERTLVARPVAPEGRRTWDETM